jgi:hypothetical protein
MRIDPCPAFHPFSGHHTTLQAASKHARKTVRHPANQAVSKLAENFGVVEQSEIFAILSILSNSFLTAWNAGIAAGPQRRAARPYAVVMFWILAFARMSASVMLPCQEGESPSDVKS